MNIKYMVTSASLAALCVASGAPAQITQQAALGADMLQTLGVGGRATAMGGAFTAVANDASATFWNPGWLGSIKQKNLMVEYRSVFNNGSSYQGEGAATVPNLTPYDAKGMQPSFFAVVYPQSYGTFGYSHALGGYAQLRMITSKTAGTGADETSTLYDDTVTMRNLYDTFSFGRSWDLAGKSLFGVGASAFRVQQYQTLRGFNTLSKGGTSDTLPDDARDMGQAVGYALGVSYMSPEVKTVSGKGATTTVTSNWQAGATYRSKTRFSGLTERSEETFGRDVPSRATLGLAWVQRRQKSTSENSDKLTLSAEMQHFSAANQVSQGAPKFFETRRAVTNLHFGFEYSPARPFAPFRGEVRTPVRFGFRTNQAGNQTLAINDNIISFGMAYQKGPDPSYIFQVEPAAEYLTKSKQFGFTLSATYYFSDLFE